MKRLLSFVALPLLIAIAMLAFYLSGGRYVSSENAYIRSGIAMVSAGSAGHIAKVLVVENQEVTVGEVLFILDPEPFDLALVRAQAELGEAKNAIALLKGHYKQHRVRLAGAEDDVRYAVQELERLETLRLNNAVSAEKLAAQQHALSVARSNVLAIEVEVSSALAELGGDARRAVDSYASVQRVLGKVAELAMARRRASVLSGVSGTVVKIDLHPGEFVQKGQAVFSIVANKEMWIEANLKETQLTYLGVGQAATFEVEAFPNKEFKAEVVSIAPASGAEFAILPPQNATGNWVKITQRIPVRLRISKDQELPPLRAGMSVTVSIDTQQQRSLAQLFGRLFS